MGGGVWEAVQVLEMATPAEEMMLLFVALLVTDETGWVEGKGGNALLDITGAGERHPTVEEATTGAEAVVTTDEEDTEGTVCKG